MERYRLARVKVRSEVSNEQGDLVQRDHYGT